MAINVAAFGGTFDPVHNGHLLSARAILERWPLDRVVFVPSAHPPHKGQSAITPLDVRLDMIRAALRDEPGFDVSDVERTLPSPNYTLNTVTALAAVLGPGVELHWIIGADSLVELDTWYRIAELADACRIVTARRPGWDAPDLSHLLHKLSVDQLQRICDGIVETPRIDIAATDIRARCAAGRSIRFLVPDAVAAIIERSGLYR